MAQVDNLGLIWFRKQNLGVPPDSWLISATGPGAPPGNIMGDPLVANLSNLA